MTSAGQIRSSAPKTFLLINRDAGTNNKTLAAFKLIQCGNAHAVFMTSLHVLFLASRLIHSEFRLLSFVMNFSLLLDMLFI